MKTFKQFSEQAYSAKENIDEGLGTLVKAGLKKIVKPAVRWISRGKNKTIPNERTASLGRLCLLYTSPSPRDATLSRMPSSA